MITILDLIDLAFGEQTATRSRVAVAAILPKFAAQVTGMDRFSIYCDTVVSDDQGAEILNLMLTAC